MLAKSFAKSIVESFAKFVRSLAPPHPPTSYHAMRGYMDKESHTPYMKPMMIVTDAYCVYDAFSQMKCQCTSNHEVIKGSNCYGSRSLQAAEWPEAFDRLMISAIEQQALMP